MKFKCERDILVESLNVASRAASKGLSGMSGVQAKLTNDQLVLTGSDRNLTISINVTVSGIEDGEAVIPARLAADIIKAIQPGAVSLEVNEGSLLIESGPSNFSIRLLSAAEFPVLEDIGSEEVTISSKSLTEALKQVVLAASSDDSRPILTGVLLTSEKDNVRLVATDSYRLAMRDIPGVSVLEEGQSVLIPSRALEELNRVLDKGETVTVQLSENKVSFHVGDVKLSAGLIEGEFPNYKGLIPDSHPNKLTVNRNSFIDTLKRVKLLASDSTPIRLEMTGTGVEMVAVTQDVGMANERVEGKYEGSDLTVAFNPQYLLEGIEVATTEDVTISTIDELKPAVINSVGIEDLLYLLMPVRV